jgi:uncharacterized protein
MRVLFWLALIVLVVMALRAKSARPSASSGPIRRDMPGGGARPSQHMVSCAQCGLYIPAPEAVGEGAQVFCCEQHRRQFFSRQ